MFTGIIEGLGTLAGLRAHGQARQLTIEADFPLEGTRVGDSIAVNGACLTAVSIRERRFTADVSPETMAKTTFGTLKIGERVNLERALRLSDRLDGHLVSGHIDGLGQLQNCRQLDNALVLTFIAAPELTRYMIRKGSVAVDGVSLTINACDSGGFQVSIIPHTARITTLGMKRVGDAVNIETDMVGKYVERFVAPNQEAGPAAGGGIDMALLARSGFTET